MCQLISQAENMRKFNRINRIKWSRLVQAHRDDAGQGYIEFMLVLPLFLITLAGLIFFGRVLYVKLALDMAVYDACRAAVEAMQEKDGLAQGTGAGRNTLRGFNLNAGGAHVDVVPQGTWTRGTRVVCRADFNVYVGDIPLAAQIAGKTSVNLQATAWSRVETWRAYWQ